MVVVKAFEGSSAARHGKRVRRSAARPRTTISAPSARMPKRRRQGGGGPTENRSRTAHSRPIRGETRAAPPRRTTWRQLSVMVLGSLFAGAVLWSVGLFRFASSIPDGVTDSSTPTDVIVVLTGGSERLETGLRLLAEHKGERMFISGVHPGVPVSDLLRVAGASTSATDPRIETGHDARDTAGNAEETANWLRVRGYRSLRLVTGNYHMPRSLLEFEHAMPDARVIPNPVFPPRFHQDDWWRSPGTAALIITEYNKYLLAIARQSLGLPSPAALFSSALSLAAGFVASPHPHADNGSPPSSILRLATSLSPHDMVPNDVHRTIAANDGLLSVNATYDDLRVTSSRHSTGEGIKIQQMKAGRFG